MRGRPTTSLFLLSLLLFVLWPSAVDSAAQTGAMTGVQLQRFIETSEPLPGEAVAMRFELINHEEAEVGYTLIEEVPLDIALLETAGGSFNQTAGFIVWRGTLAPQESLTIPYVIQVKADAQGVLPLYAYMSTTGGGVVDHFDQLQVQQLDWQVSLDNTLVQKGHDTKLHLRVTNSFDRALSIDLSFEVAHDLQIEEALPTTIQLEAGDEWTFETTLTAESVGSHSIRVTPLIGGVVTAAPRQVTLTLYDGERPRPEKETVDDTQDVRQSITTERIHEVRLPAHLVSGDEELVLVARLPRGAGYVPGSARLGDDEQVTPQISGDYLLFTLPPVEHVTVRYALRYEDRSMLSAQAPDAYNDVGLISMGQIPRVLRGDEQLLYALTGERQYEPRERVGAVILDPFDGQVFTEREQIDIEVDGPAGSEMTLQVNGVIVTRDQVGGIAQEVTRLAEKYIAIPLTVGANRIELTAVTIDGEVLTDSITVYRSGPVTQLTITPVSEMVTGRVHPLLIQVAASDEDGLAPADRTPVTVDVHGGKLLTPDAHPDWVGHQVLLYGGRALLQVEPLIEAGLLSIEARMGDVKSQTHIAVTAQADDWFVLGLGTLRAEGLFSPQGTPPATSSDLRLIARGPVGSSVFTAAIDTLANSSLGDRHTLWTGDNSSSGFLVGSGDPVHLQLEHGLSYVRYGSGRVEFAGEIARYNRMQKGIQAVVQESPNFSLHTFIDREPVGRHQQLIEGDGTAYYRLPHGAIQPGSEDLTIVVREAFFPYDVVREEGLTRSDYNIDYRTGQIWLRQPLLSRDADGNRLYLRVRYIAVDEPEHRSVGGLQAIWRLDGGHISGTARLALDAYGEASQLFVLGGQKVGPQEMTLDWEAAIARGELSVASAYQVSLTHPSLLGWNVRVAHRHIHSDVAAVVGVMQGGVTTSLVGERRLLGARLRARGSVNQVSPGAPWIAESQLDADWSWKRIRPSLGLKVQYGLATPLVTTVRTGVGFSLPAGSVALSREFPIAGEHAIHDLVEGRVNLARGLDLLFALDRESDAEGVTTQSRRSISITQALEGAVTSTILRGAYEYSDIYEPDGAMVYSATSHWPINDAHALQLVVDHRRPFGDEELPSFGGQVGWTYRHNEGESTFRIDQRTDGTSVKRSMQWRGFQPVDEQLALQVDAFFVRDDDAQTGMRVSLSGAYRTDVSAVLASASMERNSTHVGVKRSTEWRVKGAHYVSPDISVNLGYAQRMTDAPTLTDKVGLSLNLRLSDRYNLVFDGSLLRQHDSGTQLLGSRVGVGYRLTDELSLTLGYAVADYVGFDAAGSSFARRRSGTFVELTVGFDELSVAGWAGRNKE